MKTAARSAGWHAGRKRLLVALSWAALGALYLTLPPSPDQLEMDYMGWRMLEGAVPYRDFIDMNWPGVMWSHAVSTALFGNHLWSWRALDFVALAPSAFFLQSLLRRTAGATAATISIFLYPAFYVSLPQWFAGQPDTTAAQMLVGMLWCHVRAYERSEWRWQIGVGAFLAAAMLSKPTVGVVGLLLPVHALWARAGMRSIVVQTTIAAAVTLGCLALAFLALMAHGAAVREVVDATYTYNVWTQFLEVAMLRELVAHAIDVHLRWWSYLTILAAAGAVLMFRSAPARMAATALPVLWLGGVLSFLAQRRGFYYHLGPCFIPVIGLACAAVGICWEAGRARRWRPSATLLFAVPMLLVCGGAAKKLSNGYRSLVAAVAEGDYSVHLAAFEENDGLTIADAVALSDRIEREVPPDETVLVLGSASSMNFLSRRPQPTRFFYAPVLINAKPPLPMAERWNDLFESDLRSTSPHWCMISTKVRRQWLEGDSRGARALRDLLDSRYRRIGFVGSSEGLEIYERS